MRLSDYDKAVVRYFNELYPNCVFGYQERQFWQAAEDNEQVKVELPLIGINRVTNTLLFDSYNNETAVLTGHYEPVFGCTVRQIPLDLTYQLDFYSNSREEVDDLWAETVRAILDKRNIDVAVVFGEKQFKYTYPLALRSSPVDNTEIMRFTDTNKIYRLTQDFMIPQAKLFFADLPQKGDGLIHSIPVKQIVLERNVEADSYTVTGIPSH